MASRGQISVDTEVGKAEAKIEDKVEDKVKDRG